MSFQVILMVFWGLQKVERPFKYHFTKLKQIQEKEK